MYKGKGTDEFDFMKIQNICSVKINEKNITKARAQNEVIYLIISLYIE